MIARRLMLILLTLSPLLSGQTASSNPEIPRLVRYSGIISHTTANSSNTIGVTFALYRDQEGGSPLWLETQNVATDAQGHFSVLLGSTNGEGLPADMFATNEARWLGVKAEGQEEQPRVLLVSVPYAIKAGDAETLGGKPLSAFLLNPNATNSEATAPAARSVSGSFSAGLIQPNTSVTTTGYLPMFADSAGDLTNSLVYQGTNGVVGVNTASPVSTQNSKLHVNGNILLAGQPTHEVIMVGSASTGRLGQDGGGFLFASDTPGKSVRFLTTPSGGSLTSQMYVLASGNVAIGTSTANSKLTVAGTIQSTSGGFKFPDGSVLSSANNNTNVTTSVNYSGSTTTQIVDAVQNQAGVSGGFDASGVPSGVRGDSTTTTGYAAGVFGSAASIYAPGVAGVNTSQCDASDLPPAAPICKSYGVFGWSVQATRGTGVWGQADNTTEDNVGVYGQASGQYGTGVFGYAANDSTGDGTGVYGLSVAPDGAGVWGYAKASSGSTVGVYGAVASTGGYAGQFDAPTGGNILLGRSGTSTYTNVFRVDSTGKGYFNGGTQTSGADFAESVDVIGSVSKYEPGDVMMIDSTGSRRLALAKGAYSTKVAGIYSTKPGMLATPHDINDARVGDEVPLAIVGIVPCKVTAENGPIHAGDLLVTASRPGYAMRGTNRRRMLGAVVGKALGSLDKGTGTIEVLVSLH